MFTLNVNPELCSVYGPFSIHAYGVFMALGVLVFLLLSWSHPLRKKWLSSTRYEHLMVGTMVSCLAGARTLHLISEWHTYDTLVDALSIWNGGLSILGAVVGGLVFVPLFLWYNRIPLLPVLDLGALYLPLTQAIARLGCLFAGCCFGSITHSWCAIIYTHVASHAPLGVPLYPTQLLSSLSYLAIFMVLQLFYFTKHPRAGTISGLYLILLSIERFVIDFYRGDRIIDTGHALVYSSWLSMHQWISLGVAVLGIGLLLYAIQKKDTRY